MSARAKQRIVYSNNLKLVSSDSLDTPVQKIMLNQHNKILTLPHRYVCQEVVENIYLLEIAFNFLTDNFLNVDSTIEFEVYCL